MVEGRVTKEVAGAAAEAEHRTRTLRGWCEDRFRDMETRFTAINVATEQTKSTVQTIATQQKVDEGKHKRLQQETTDNHSEVMGALSALLAGQGHRVPKQPRPEETDQRPGDEAKRLQLLAQAERQQAEVDQQVEALRLQQQQEQQQILQSQQAQQQQLVQQQAAQHQQGALSPDEIQRQQQLMLEQQQQEQQAILAHQQAQQQAAAVAQQQARSERQAAQQQAAQAVQAIQSNA